MTGYQIRTPFLRYLLFYYGNLAVQLRPVRLNNPISLINFFWNLFLTVTCFSIAISQVGRYEEETLEQIAESASSNSQPNSVFIQQSSELLSKTRTFPSDISNKRKLNKPLFEIFTKLAFRYAFPTAYVSCLLYFFALSLFSRSNLVELFDSFQVDHFNSRLKSARMTLRIILATHANFLTVVPSFFWADARKANWLNPIEVVWLLYTYFTFYVLKFCILLIIGVIFYYRYAVYSSLKKIQTDFEEGEKSLKSLELRIRKLAFTCSQINRLLAVPLLLITFIYTFDTIIEFASLLLDNNRLDIFYQLAISSNLLIIVYYNEAINWELKSISCNIQNNFQIAQKANLLFHKSTLQTSEAEVHQVLKSREIVDVYREYFQLKLYNFFTFSMSFTFSTALFILNYSVLVTQTNAG